MLKINEIYHSIQGESTSAGKPCVFVRLTYCNLRCAYCDTEYAFYNGKDMSFQQVIDEVEKYNCKLVEVTGGEPLVQMEECLDLMNKLCDLGYEVMIETGGSFSIKDIDPRVKIIMDLKCPSSEMEKKNFYDNFQYLKQTDELKFVIGEREDYDWTIGILKKYNLFGKCEILFSVVFGELEPVELVNWILKDKLEVRFQLQMHKYIWHPETKGV
ncbi:MAG: radical SAM protein [Ignavibacteriaceae bacterium]|jgi:7-carboxy-7-deazaguanine synthase|nr:radical SAM protein [Ignavibacteriaceae bacterium]MCW8816268.1 radical SAM protein [Ignavibacteriaceae bacterium]MCW8824348.1 radical SAM protein [Ignavibacteriaceae bacterium]MCW8960045.1 radical SAM protein [Ignavibacteriaceae bacterium]MCW8995017.1 radical SAM protein [Psychromonas sp.]